MRLAGSGTGAVAPGSERLPRPPADGANNDWDAVTGNSDALGVRVHPDGAQGCGRACLRPSDGLESARGRRCEAVAGYGPLRRSPLPAVLPAGHGLDGAIWVERLCDVNSAIPRRCGPCATRTLSPAWHLLQDRSRWPGLPLLARLPSLAFQLDLTWGRVPWGSPPGTGIWSAPPSFPRADYEGNRPARRATLPDLGRPRVVTETSQTRNSTVTVDR